MNKAPIKFEKEKREEGVKNISVGRAKVPNSAVSRRATSHYVPNIPYQAPQAYVTSYEIPIVILFQLFEHHGHEYRAKSMVLYTVFEYQLGARVYLVRP